VRPPNPHAKPLPTFRNQVRATSTQAVSSLYDFFNPDGMVTVQWIVVQTSAPCTIQILLNRQPFGVPLTVGAGAIIRFAGTLLANNELLSFSVSAATTLSWEVVWIPGLHLENIVTETDVPFPGGFFPQVQDMGDEGTHAATFVGKAQIVPQGARSVFIYIVGAATSSAGNWQPLLLFTADNGTTFYRMTNVPTSGTQVNSSCFFFVGPNAQVPGNNVASGGINLPANNIANQAVNSNLPPQWLIQYNNAAGLVINTCKAEYN
jgi:hypothetical protein